MSDLCPTCGQPMPRRTIASVDALVAALRVPVPQDKWPRRSKKSAPIDPGRQVYAAQDGSYFITYGGAEVGRATVKEAVAAGRLVREYPEAPNVDCWRLA